MAREDWKAYQYTPSKVGAIVACILFAIVTVVCAAQMFIALIRLRDGSRKKVLITIPFILGGVFECVGYLGRILSLDDVTELGPYIMQSLLLLVAPALFAASIYMAFGRVMAKLKADHHSIIRLKWLTKIFVTGDVISFFVQAGGGGIESSSSALTIKIGRNLIIVGLFLQIVFFGFFIIVMGIFQRRIIREPTLISVCTRHLPSSLRNWQMVVVTLFSCSILIFVRSVVRAIEYIQGNDGYIISHEIFLYMLDGLLMLLQMVLYCLQDISGFFSYREERARVSEAIDTMKLSDYEKF